MSNLRIESGPSGVDPELNAAHILVDYAWRLLEVNMPTVWVKNKYGGMVPIVPVKEEVDLEKFAGPRIVYGYAESPTGALHARSAGSLTFAVYDDSFRRLTQTLTVLKTAFERQDEAARSVNNFSTYFLGNKTTKRPGPYLGLRFGTIDVGFVEGGTPETTEGGRQSGIINIRYEYYVNYRVTTEI